MWANNNRRWWMSYPDETDRHLVAALFHFISMFLVMISLVQLSWFEVKGYSPPQIGPKDFLTFGRFEARQDVPSPNVMDVVICYHSDTSVHDCVSLEMLILMRILVFLCIMTIFSCMVGFCLDVIGPTKKSLRFIRRNALPSIWAVLCIISMIGVSYFLTTSLEMAGHNYHPEKTIQVSYGSGFYVISIAGVFSLLATACNVLQEPMSPRTSQAVRRGPLGRHNSLGRCRLVDDDLLEPPPYPVTYVHPSPPPPYTP